MRIGWGWGITIFIFAFIAFILVMVIMAFGTTTELYAEDYYQQEVEFQDKIDAKIQGKAFIDSFIVNVNNQYVQIETPVSFTNSSSCKVSFYRSNNSELDRNFDFTQELNASLNIPLTEFHIGNYGVVYQWKDNGLNHRLETRITIP